MCGIAGILHRDGGTVDRDVLIRMTRTLKHRGPDEEGYFLNQPCGPTDIPLHSMEGRGTAGLGHRRLSIIDLKSGQQPLSNEDGTIWISFNGEIYNFAELKGELERLGHRFRTNSDTETIVHGYEEWGDELPTRLRGMFAFTIWDEKRQRLFLARDRLGMKPLYYLDDRKRLLLRVELNDIESA